MRPRRVVNTTLGDLISEMTDQITPYLRDPTAVYLIVECILSDLIAQQRLRFQAGRSGRRPRVYH
jgi:hypothetical protein